MSDEGRRYVKEFSPFTGTTFWVHYVLGDLANRQHDYELFIGDRRLKEEWPFSARAVERARAELIADGFLTMLDERSAPGRPIRYRFEFPELPPNARHSGDRTNARQRAENARQSGGERPPNRQPHLLSTEVGTEPNGSASTIDLKVDPLYGFPHFWGAYPRRNGKRVGRGKAETIWRRLSLDDRKAAWRGACHLASAITEGLWPAAKDPERFLRDRVWEDWQTPATPDERPDRQGRRQAAAADRLAATIRGEAG